MVKNVGPVFNKTPDPSYIQKKKKQLVLFAEDLVAVTDPTLVEKVQEELGKPVDGNIVNLALELEEDIAIMKNGVLSAICFCFPSGWIPRTAIGKSLAEIHKPVADGDHLRSVSGKLTKTMADPVLGSFRRGVWTITKVPSLSCHPSIIDCYKNEEINLHTLFFRYEEQTDSPF